MASTVRPSRLESREVPARSRLVKMRPARPRAAWLWSICSARVDLPQSIVPVKKVSSAIADRSCQTPAMTLVSTDELAALLARRHDDLVILDVRWALTGPSMRSAYDEAHL